MRGCSSILRTQHYCTHSRKCSHHSILLYTAAPYGTHSRLHSQHSITLWTAPTSHAHAISYCALHPPSRPIAPYCGRSRTDAQHSTARLRAATYCARLSTTQHHTVHCAHLAGFIAPYCAHSHADPQHSTAQHSNTPCSVPILRTQHYSAHSRSHSQHSTTQHNTAPHQKLQHLTGHNSSHPQHSIPMCNVPTSPVQAVSHCAHSRTDPQHGTARLSTAQQHTVHCAHVPGR